MPLCVGWVVVVMVVMVVVVAEFGSTKSIVSILNNKIIKFGSTNSIENINRLLKALPGRTNNITCNTLSWQ